MLTYDNIERGTTTVKVRLDGKVVGHIQPVFENEYSIGYQYVPTGTDTGGEIFHLLGACKRSLV